MAAEENIREAIKLKRTTNKFEEKADRAPGEKVEVAEKRNGWKKKIVRKKRGTKAEYKHESEK